MAATIISMDLKLADTFNVSELMPEDLIEIDGVVCEVVAIDALKEGYAINYLDEYGEAEVIEVDDDATFNLYVYIDD